MRPQATARRAVAWSGAVGAVLLAAGLGVAGGAATWTTASAAGSAPAPARTHVIEIRGFGFEPAALEAAPGDTVVWINRDVVPHTATANDRAWDTGNIAAGASAQRVLRSGDAEYFCLYHLTMKGRLSVRRGGGAASTAPRIQPAPR
jgi:plastocyanin